MATGNKKEEAASKKASLKVAAESSNIMESQPASTSTRVSTEVIETVAGLKEAKLKDVMDSTTDTDIDTNDNTGNNSKTEQDSQRITRKRGAQPSPPKAPKKKGRPPGKKAEKKAEKKAIATEDALVSLMAVDNSGVVVGHGRIDSKRTCFHGQQIPDSHHLVNLYEAISDLYKLPFPDMNDDPIQEYLKDAIGGPVLWPSEYVVHKV
jgi:hypothetical protein